MSQLLQYYKSFSQGNKAPAASNVTGPTFEDLSIDDTLTELQRLVRYSKSAIGLQRLVHVKMVTHIARNVGFDDTIVFILPLLDELSYDPEPAIKQQLVDQLGYLGEYFVEHGEKGYTVLVDIILPLTARLLEDPKSEVRQTAAGTLVKIAGLVRTEDLGQHVLTIVLRLAHVDDKEETRMTAAQLLNLLAEVLGQELCKQFVIPEVVSLAEDPVFRVRKSTALNFHNVCRIGGDYELFERLMPAFVRLSKDDMYRVRRACAESVFAISEHVSDDIRIGVLVEIFLRFAQDPARLVKQSILQQSGMFISTLPASVVNETILGHYISMAADPTGDITVDAELKHYCAFSFPAVLQTITSARWLEIRELYHSLIQCRAPNVRQSMAASLHEVARLLGDVRLVEEELVPVFEDMVQDIESVQMGVMKNLAQFLSHLTEPCRVSYLPELHNILHHRANPFNWRLRQCLAVQLPALLDLPPLENVYVTLFPLVMTLLQDPVASVKRSSFEGVAKLVLLLYNLAEEEKKRDDGARHQQHLDSVLKAVNGLALGDKYQNRQLWADLCLVLLKRVPKEVFETYFINGLLCVITDGVSNVRSAAASVLCEWEPEYKAPWEPQGSANTDEAAQTSEAVEKQRGSKTADFLHDESPWIWLLARDDIKECLGRLRRDHIDVVVSLRKLTPMFPDLQLEAISCKRMKEAPGGNEPIINSTTKKSSRDAFRRLYGMDESDSRISDVEPVDLEVVSMRLSGKQDVGALEQVLAAPAAETSPDDDEPLVLSGSPPSARSGSPTLEEAALEIEEVGALDRVSKLEQEENQSSDPDFLPVKDKESEEENDEGDEVEDLPVTVEE